MCLVAHDTLAGTDEFVYYTSKCRISVTDDVILKVQLPVLTVALVTHLGLALASNAFEVTYYAQTISVIPEDCPEDDCKPPESPELREPEVDYDEHAVSDLNMDSDAESFDMESEIEDNFVELAGGHAVKDSETESEEGENSKTAENNKPVIDAKPIETDMSKLSRDKVSLMERFLYGTNERSANTSSSYPPDNSSEDDYPDDATIMNREFEKVI
ncbi:unnamed protein product [Trichobilharzia regenti]|nr:unnamed protein product [Trichobilharzia regenti]